MKNSVLILSIILLSSTVFAATELEKINIPGAFCGDGSPYKILLRKGLTDKLAFYFNGGGACWNKRSCRKGGIPFTTLHLKDDYEKSMKGILSSDPLVSPISNHSLVIFPYCTGDLFAGTHVANYKGRVVRHNGRENIEKSLDYLNQNNIIDESQAKQVTIYGDSAGALGAMFNLDLMSSYGTEDANKTLILDSPGLHWGDRVWSKFSSTYIEDIQKAGERVYMPIDKKVGNVAHRMPMFCDSFPEWKVGILQAGRDLVMSLVFGNISSRAHSRNVYSENGIDYLTKDKNDNCSSWINNSKKHVFLKTDEKINSRNDSSMSAKDFMFQRILSDIDQPAASFK